MEEDKNTQKTSGDSKSSLDLSELKDFAFGPDWSSGGKSSSPKPREFSRSRESQGPREGGSGERRSRRPASFKRELQSGGDAPGGDQQRSAPRGARRGPRDGNRPPRESTFRPTVEVSFYPEDAPFKALTTAVRNSLRTYQLFELANLILEKPDRFVVIVKPKPKEEGETPLLYTAVPDGAPFESEDEAVAYVFRNHQDKFFDTEEIEVDPPKGAFTQINRCGMTGELLGPPNFHRYQQLLMEHHTNRLAHVPYEVFERRIESVRDEAVVQEWLDKMKKQTRYTWKLPYAGEHKPVFEAMEAARLYVLTHHRDKIVKSEPTARFSGKVIEQLPLGGSIRRSVEHELERQRKFPLDTANNLRGRLRRLKFTIYKKGSKGVSYVSPVKRKFREQGQVFAASIQSLIEFIEKNQSIKASDLVSAYLGFDPKAVAEGETLPEEQLKVLTQFKRDLHWLISEGYVVEYGDGTLLALPVRTPEQGQQQSPEPSTPQPAEVKTAEEDIVAELKADKPDMVEEVEKAKAQEAKLVEDSAPVAEENETAATEESAVEAEAQEKKPE